MRLLVITLLMLGACDQLQHAAPSKVDAPRAALEPSFVFATPAHEPTLHFRITAPRSRALYLDNCNGAFVWGLEHQQSGSWKYAWGQEVNGCHSKPIKISAGTALEFRKVLAVRQGEMLPPGPYRLAIYGLYFTHDSLDHSASIEVPHIFRVSEPFTHVFSVAP